jgi:hypothetical protein
LVGGQAAPAIVDQIDNGNVQLLADLESLGAVLDHLMRCGDRHRVDH